MSIPVRVDGDVVADVDIVGIDIEDGRASLVVERTDNQNRFAFRLGTPVEFRLPPPLPGEGEQP